MILLYHDAKMFACKDFLRILYHEAKMLACKGIFARPSMTQANGVCEAERPKTCVARLSAFIIPHRQKKSTISRLAAIYHPFRQGADIMMLSAVVRTTSAHKESGIFYSNRRGLKESLCDSFGGHDIQYDIKKKRRAMPTLSFWCRWRGSFSRLDGARSFAALDSPPDCQFTSAPLRPPQR